MRKDSLIRISITTVAALCIILFSIKIFQNNLKQKLTADIYNRLSELSVNNASSISSKINDQLDMMKALAAYLADEDLRSDNVLSLINKTVDSYGFLRCAITFPDGSFITHDSKNTGNTVKDEYVTKGFQGITTITGPREAVVDPSKTVILLTVPIIKEEDVRAVLTFTYETQYLNKVFKMTSFKGKGYSYIIDNNGTIISKPGIEDTIYNGDNILDFINKQFSSQDMPKEINENIQDMQSGSAILPIAGDEKFISYQPLGINDWYIFSITSGDVLKQQLNGMLKDVYVLSAIIIAIFLILTVLISHYIWILQNKVKKELQQLAYYDNLTQIPNKNYFDIRAREILDNASGEYAYIILNVNKFKIINDIFGLAQGDNLLQYIAGVIHDETRKEEISARFDADNFHILSTYQDMAKLDERLWSVADKICSYHFDKMIPHTLSIGFGVYIVEDKTKPVSLMGDKARMALSKIKGIHTTATYYYDKAIIEQFKEEQEIENIMKSALKDGEMLLYLQPKYSVDKHKIVGAEALVRWLNPKRGMIMPDHFIPLFEKNGFVIELDMYMVATACKTLLKWQKNGTEIVPVSVNQSRQCLYQKDYVSKLMKILNQYGVSPSLIELEITERAFFEDENKLIEIIRQLHNYGFLIAMDDFGAGYSSLNMLQDINVDFLKIDKNFFKESVHSERGKKIVSNIISMAKDLDIKVVAEGIETKEQLAFLTTIHCNIIQGYYFSKPVCIEEFEEKLKKDGSA